MYRALSASKSVRPCVRAFSQANDTLYPPTQRLKGQVAIVTGASAGIGLATAKAMLHNGIDGIMCADINGKALEATYAELEKHLSGLDVKPKIVYQVCDVSKEEDMKALVEETVKKLGKLTVLFNNAGIMHSDDDNAMNTRNDVWDKTFDINVKGVWYGCKYGIPAMQKAGRGSIINTSSFVAKMGAATCQLAYTSSKGAVSAMTRELAAVHAKENIRVNNLCPGPLRTKLLMDFLDTEDKKQRRLVHIPMGRFGEATEMAETVVFLASNESSYMTGQEVLVDGGITTTYVTPL